MRVFMRSYGDRLLDKAGALLIITIQKELCLSPNVASSLGIIDGYVTRRHTYHAGDVMGYFQKHEHANYV
ncbi:hypothetical protein BCON_0004g00870 [Botryotinia convoluta]|uniref:Uncharacterized protein n=1 Tax=Botryotinia convoluta TaxID=54673 RepID=A0A4Z1J0H4_9HELO|nr:hypothetical protein BCON_0004g00870 [Botryotinia convoluta]